MTELERARDDLLASIGAALVQLNVGEANERDLCAKLEAFEATRAKQHDEDRNGATGKADCGVAPPPEHCQGCSTGFSLAKAICCECIEAQKGQANS